MLVLAHTPGRGTAHLEKTEALVHFPSGTTKKRCACMHIRRLAQRQAQSGVGSAGTAVRLSYTLAGKRCRLGRLGDPVSPQGAEQLGSWGLDLTHFIYLQEKAHRQLLGQASGASTRTRSGATQPLSLPSLL